MFSWHLRVPVIQTQLRPETRRVPGAVARVTGIQRYRTAVPESLFIPVALVMR